MLKIIRSLGNRNYGLILGFLIVLNLACGSLVMNFFPDTYPRFALLDFGFFFNPASAVHIWFYVLICVMSLFGINISVCTVEAFLRLLKSKANRRRQISALLCHLAILLALAAHLHEGLAGRSQQIRISSQGTNLPGIGRVSAESVSLSTHPDGSRKDAKAVLAFELLDGSSIKKTISYNNPAIFHSGKDEVIILHGENTPVGLILVDSEGNKLPGLTFKSPLALAGGVLSLNQIFPTQHNIFFAALTWAPEGSPKEPLYLALDRKFQGHNQIMTGKQGYRFESTIDEGMIHAMVRHNPSIPYMLISLLLLTSGCALLIRRPRFFT